MLTTVLTIIEYIGVVSFAISGALMAIDKENDFIGVIFLALITTFGGGMIRDIFIGHNPPVFFTLYPLVITCIVTATVTFVLAAIFKRKYVENENLINSVNNYIDALGLGVFVISGAKLCIDLGIDNPFLIVIMGMISGTGGSMTRDIIMNEVPALLRRRVYLVAAICGAALYYALYSFGVSDIISMPVSIILIVLIRILATVFKLNFPKAIDFSKMSENK